MIHSFSLDDSTQLQLRRSLRDSLPWMASGHLCEAIAAAFGFRTYAALNAAAKQTLPGQRQFVYFSRPRFCAHLWEHGYPTSNANGKGLCDVVAPLHGGLPYAHRAPGPEWQESGPLMAYASPRRLVECCKLVLREVHTHRDAHHREALGEAARGAYESAFKTFFQPGTLLQAVDEMGMARTVQENGSTVLYNFTNDAFLCAVEVAQQRYQGLAWINRGLADKTLAFENVWAMNRTSSALLEEDRMPSSHPVS